MRLMLALGYLTTLLMSLTSSASILPPNELHLEDKYSLVGDMSKTKFNAIIDKVADYYSPIIADKGGVLEIERRWDDSTVNAVAERNLNFYKVIMFGGLARRPEITADGFLLVVCHELGHHLAGYPFIDDWAANEGQADYFATQSCTKNIWKNDHEINSTFRAQVDPVAKKKCDLTYSAISKQNLCYRTSEASRSIGNLLAKLGDITTPSFATPDNFKVTTTFHGHPPPQCRLDTLLAGSLCTVKFDQNIIPGLIYEDEWLERDIKMERDALTYSCSQYNTAHVMSKRPQCWFSQLTEN